MAISRPCGTFDRSYDQDMAIVRTRLQWILLIGGLILLMCLPLVLNSQLVNLVIFIAITIIALQGLNILMGYTGLPSMGQAAFIGVGAYTSALLTTHGVPFLIALPCAGLSSGIIGVIFGLPAVRIKGFYLAMATLAAQFIIPALISNPLEPITGGIRSLRVPIAEIFGFQFSSPQAMFYLAIPICILMVFFAKNIVRTGTGRAFIAVRDNDLAAEVMGINIFKYKLLAFFICSVYAGIAGSLWAHWIRAINPEHFTLMDSIWYLGMLIVGGTGSISGAVFGAIFLRGLDFIATNYSGALADIMPGIANAQSAVAPIVYGLVIMLFIIFEPRGLAHRWEIFKASYRLRPFPY